MPNVNSTLRDDGIPELVPDVICIADFGDTVGVGRCLNEEIPTASDGDSQCWFEIVSGPMCGKTVMCKRRQFGPSMDMGPHLARTCAFCGKMQLKKEGERRMKRKKMQQCGRCRSVYYCGDVCQGLDWKEHKVTCRRPSSNDLRVEH